MSSFKKGILLVSALLVALGHLWALIKKENIYPFYNYNMFAEVKLSPIFNSMSLIPLDQEKNALPLYNDNVFLFNPYNYRGFSYALQSTLKKSNKAETLMQLLKLAQAKNPEISGLRLYYSVCKCDHNAALQSKKNLTELSNCSNTFLKDIF